MERTFKYELTTEEARIVLHCLINRLGPKGAEVDVLNIHRRVVTGDYLTPYEALYIHFALMNHRSQVISQMAIKCHPVKIYLQMVEDALQKFAKDSLIDKINSDDN